jgi:DNA helicase-2/ATP-dependent DNA helicase PcrA
MEEGLFPHENSMNDRDGLEEERRLMYVAITRARKRLYLSHSQTRMLHGQTRYNMKSRFFEELPEEALKWITPKQAGFAGRAGVGGFGSSGHFGGGFGSGAGRTDAGQGGGAFRPDYAKYAAPVVAQRPESSGHSFKVGQKLFHAKFGEGTVLALEGSGADARAQINFPRHGVKWLALRVAKLTPLP